MDKFGQVTGIVVPINRVNVDTDQLIPKQFLKLLERTGLGKYLFNDWRFNPDGSPKSDFVLNNPRYEGGRILLARENFGSGSSREPSRSGAAPSTACPWPTGQRLTH